MIHKFNISIWEKKEIPVSLKDAQPDVLKTIPPSGIKPY